MTRDKKPLCEDDEPIRLPNPMVGFGVPTDSCTQLTHRNLPEAAMGPPYFYYENVALAPKGVWDTISRFLYDVEPEFVDSKYFCAAARKRGYVHNLPIHNRCPLRPIPPLTISEALPLTKRWWPDWDTRTKLNCLQTCIGSAKLTERIRKALEDYDGEPPLHIQNYVLNECRKWNLVWVGRNKLAPLEPDEVEMLLGFPRNHTRGGGISRTDRYKSLGNSFQVCFFLSSDMSSVQIVIFISASFWALTAWSLLDEFKMNAQTSVESLLKRKSECKGGRYLKLGCTYNEFQSLI